MQIALGLFLLDLYLTILRTVDENKEAGGPSRLSKLLKEKCNVFQQAVRVHNYPKGRAVIDVTFATWVVYFMFHAWMVYMAKVIKNQRLAIAGLYGLYELSWEY